MDNTGSGCSSAKSIPGIDQKPDDIHPLPLQQDESGHHQHLTQLQISAGYNLPDEDTRYESVPCLRQCLSIYPRYEQQGKLLQDNDVRIPAQPHIYLRSQFPVLIL